MATENRDMNRDPISGKAGAHPVGTGIGAAGGAAAGAMTGALFGPIGMLVGGTVGAVAGGLAGKGVAEQIDPTGETQYWRDNYQTRPYYNRQFDYDTDYAPAYSYGTTARATHAGRNWDNALEADLRDGWEKTKGKSRLAWDNAKDAVRDAWDRSDRTYRAYDATDRTYEQKFAAAEYKKAGTQYDDYRPAYRYGTYARSLNADRAWDSSTESELERGWDKAKGNSKLAWNDAKSAVRDAWHGAEHLMPGDADHDGR